MLAVFSNLYPQAPQSIDNTPKWLRNAVISPDGSQIAFSYQGDIFTVPASGGQALRLTIHEAYDADPVWSNNGKQIAFSSTRYGNKDVFVLPATGGVAKRLTYHSADDVPSDFSPSDDKVIFASSRLDDVATVIFPSAVLPELYEIAVNGGMEKRIIATPAEMAVFSNDGNWLFFHDRKGYEDPWRKHHTSSVTRDLWLYNIKDKQYFPVTESTTEERNPVFGNNNEYFFLSERSGSFNVWKASLVANKESNAQQVTNFAKHPVRFLSRSANGTLCYTWDGEIYTQPAGGQPQKVAIAIQSDERYNEKVVEAIKADAQEFAISPNGKEAAVIVHGEVFVVSIEFGVTKRITDTPEQERNIQFSPDGKSLLYSGERGGCWNLYESSIVNKDEKYMFDASEIKETLLVNSGKESFQGQYSPDGKEIAFLEERTTVRVFNKASGKSRTVLEGKYNYSYTDGDQYFTWSPDSKWLLVTYLAYQRWNTDIGLVNVNDGKMPINLSQSGYNNQQPKFGMDGSMVYWASDKEGYRSHGSWGSESDVYAIFLTEDAHKKFQLNKAEYALWKEQEDAKKDKDKDKGDNDKKDKDKKDKGDDKADEKKPVKPIRIDFEGLQDRKEKLTIHSSKLSDFVVDKDGENIYYLTRFEEENNLWRTKFREKETKLFVNLNSGDSKLEMDKKEENLFLIEKGGKLAKISVKEGKKENVNFSSEMNLNQTAERAYMFEHAWRQFKKKFYLADLHGIDWDFYKKEYAKFLPYINNSVDFADLLGEMLGESNASHTGGRYRPKPLPTNDMTASLGVYLDNSYTGNGVRIAEVLDKSPMHKTKQKIKAGVIIEAIDGVKITPAQNYYALLNRKADKKTQVSLFDEQAGKRWNEVVEPITLSKENGLAYERWVKNREKDVERLSGGRIGYVHVEGMNSESFRTVFEKALGKYHECEALIVDTRFNGGGWLHDDLATFLSGKPYMTFEPRGQKMGSEPLFKWQKPSAVLISEGNYSDAHMFPYTYKALGIGKLIGMPVPGTGTAVWWEKMIDGSTVFGIPQIGMRTVAEDRLMENFQLEPDVKVKNEPGKTNIGEDQQLKKAVEELLKK
ncbi:peptidase S41 [Flavobacterium album]|uniref:Tricorn protease homolog n=2 Tax=Flavobacterium album TaxID=2175091 RepID=A0A2S1R2K0_9FLAO|nr:peptidase S41 [Flavobacterium album]